jgi:putative transferase (TIGR04331 family)
MKNNLITDFLHSNQNNNLPKKYLELPVFDQKNNLKKNIIYYEKWNNYEKKLSDVRKTLKLYDHFLNELTIFLNNYHNTKYSKRYWSIILGQWLYKFISTIYFKWNLIHSLKKKNYIFLKKEINTKDIIPLGIEDYAKISNSNYWNHYIFTKIIEHSFSEKFKIKKIGKIVKNYEKKIIYQKLEHKNIKDSVSIFIQKILNFLPQNKNALIFSTYMSNLQEIKLNFLVNNSLLYYKSLRPYLLFKKRKLFEYNRKKFKNLGSSKNGLKKFLSKEILVCMPSAYLENFKNIESIVNKIPFPKSPKKIFTTLGIYRSTLMDRYIAKNVENGSSLILAQHGGAYFQHKLHFSSIHEVRISDQYLSWGNIKKKNVIPLGIIKNLNSSSKRSNKIILEVRKRTGYIGEIKIDSGFIENKKYFDNLCIFFSLLKGKKISEDIFVKLHQTKSFWNDKKQFLSHNSELKFLDEKKSMIKEISSAKLIIQTFCGTGHLESLAINKPTLILFVHNLNLLNNRSKIYFKKFIKLGIVHKTPKSLLKMLETLENQNIEKWWNLKKRQNVLKKYKEDFCIFNKEKIKDLQKIITNA